MGKVFLFVTCYCIYSCEYWLVFTHILAYATLSK